MIELLTSATPNGHKVSIALEELELPYSVRAIDLSTLEQKSEEFLALNPNGRIPVIIDHDNEDYVVFESGAILLYLAEKTGKLWPQDPAERATGYQWLFWQMSYLGPMMGQLHHFVQYAPEKLEYPIARYSQEVERLRRLLNRHLEDRNYILEDYSIADIACVPWLKMFSFRYPNQEPYPNLDSWLNRVYDRPAVQRGVVVNLDKIRPVVLGTEPVMDSVRKHLFASYQSSDGPTR